VTGALGLLYLGYSDETPETPARQGIEHYVTFLD